VRSALLKYVIDKQLGGDDGFIRDLYESEPGDWNDAFESATLPFGDYVTGFFTDYLNGGYGPTAAACYNDITSGKMAKVGVSKEMQLPDKGILNGMRAGGEIPPPLVVVPVSVGAYGAQLVVLPVYLETLEKINDEDAVVFKVSGDCAFRVFEISSDFGRATTVHAPNDAGEVVIGGFNKSTSNYMVLVVGLHDNGKQDCYVIAELSCEDDNSLGPFVGTSTIIETSEDMEWGNRQVGNVTEMSYFFEIVNRNTGEGRFISLGHFDAFGFYSMSADGNIHFEGEGDMIGDFTKVKCSIDITDNGTKLNGSYTFEGTLRKWIEDEQVDVPMYIISTITATKQ